MVAPMTSSSMSPRFDLEEGERSNLSSNQMGIGGGGYDGSRGGDEKGGDGHDNRDRPQREKENTGIDATCVGHYLT
ncbi:hypothetical protein Q3G72_032687 [Acer saccharum]|nr:hypothetical protein Q3G72_032687 [Acer saccharum]